MDVAHAILFAKAIDISRVTADYSSAKFEFFITMMYPVAKIRITINSKEVIRATSLLFRNGSGRSSRLANTTGLSLILAL